MDASPPGKRPKITGTGQRSTATDAILGGYALFTRAGGIERLRGVSPPLPGARGSWAADAIGQFAAASPFHLPDAGNR